MHSIEKVIFTSDVYRISENSSNHIKSPQGINIDWIYALFAPILGDLLQVPCDKFSGEDPSLSLSRVRVLRDLVSSLTPASWAGFYDQELPEEQASLLVKFFSNSLVIGFETPPYLAKILLENNIPFIDFAIHPVRFLDDYILGMKTNVPEWSDRIAKQALDESVFFDYARISAARSARAVRGFRPEFGSAVFLGQLAVDASLIQNGRLFDLEDLHESLIDLRQKYTKVYYKYHPHLENRSNVQKIISSIKGCESVEMNIYDLLSCSELDLVTGFSSSAIHEAKYFGRKTSRVMTTPDLFDLSLASSHFVFYPMPKDVVKHSFWKHLFDDGDDSYEKMPASDFAHKFLKYSLNMKWGR